MGVQIAEILPKKEIELSDLGGRKIAIDAYNTLYQFLSIIRDRFTGEPLKDSKGNVTSHLSGLFYRTANLIESGVKPVFVFDGKSPDFKRGTQASRIALKEEAVRKWEEAVKAGEKAIRYAQASSYLTREMADEAKRLLDFMGVPWVQAPSEGEAQCAFMCMKGDVFAAASQDSDSLLFGTPCLVRNISITGRRKLPKKETYIEIKPEIIKLKDVLSELGITREQLIIASMLVGTDYNPDGIRGMGPKKSLALVKECRTLEKVMEKVEWKFDVTPQSIMDFFMKPPTTENYTLEWKDPDIDRLKKFLVDEHDFSADRIDKFSARLKESAAKGRQSSLGSWFK